MEEKRGKKQNIFDKILIQIPAYHKDIKCTLTGSSKLMPEIRMALKTANNIQITH